MNKSESSRELAKTWPYGRYGDFERGLQNAAAKWFAQKGYQTHPKRAYCLKSRDEWSQNIICQDVVSYIEIERTSKKGKESFPLHQYVHHGLSSQAMLFNLVGPLIVREDLGPLKAALANANVPWPEGQVSIEFEHGDGKVFNEDAGQKTSIDVMISGVEQGLFIEAKLVEREFGGCSVFAGGNCEGQNPIITGLNGCYLYHIGREYWQRMEEYGFFDVDFAKGPICPLVNYYQFFRELLFSLHKKGKFILLHDERNPAFQKRSSDGRCTRGLWPFLLQAVPPRHEADAGRITIQQVVHEIEKSQRHSDWIAEFKAKYGIL